MSSTDARPQGRKTGSRSLWSRWMLLGEKAANIIGLVVFAILYVICMTPVAVALKLLRHPLLPMFPDGAESYYTVRPREDTPAAVRIQKQW